MLASNELKIYGHLPCSMSEISWSLLLSSYSLVLEVLLLEPFRRFLPRIATMEYAGDACLLANSLLSSSSEV